MTSDVLASAEIELMKRIREKWVLEIAVACQLSSVTESFLAALIANESGGNPFAKRFESGVLTSLWKVLHRREAAYGSIGHDDILRYVSPYDGIMPNAIVREWVQDGLDRLDALATSWGLTQIMGYEAIPFGIQVPVLADPERGLHITTRMLGDLSKRWGLDLGKDFSELFAAWNTGRPHSPTADPKYIPNGLARMAIYERFSQNREKASAPAPATGSAPQT